MTSDELRKDDLSGLGEMPAGWEPKVSAQNVRPSAEFPPVRSTEHQWEYRHQLSDAQLMDAAGQCLTLAANIISDKVSEADVQLWLLRAQWYMLRLEGRNRSFREGLLTALTMQGQTPTGRQVFDTNPPSYGGRFSTMYPPLGSEDIPPLPKRESTKAQNLTPLPRETCDDLAPHSRHTWPAENDKLCLGRGEGGIALRPIRDNPQA